jgi:hypothetical protein
MQRKKEEEEGLSNGLVSLQADEVWFRFIYTYTT